MSKPTTAFPSEVYVRSLPWSLRHCGHPSETITDARDIAVFLAEVLTTQRAPGLDIGDTNMGNWNNGLELCFDLLIDKLDIAAGVYKFPTLTHDEAAPHLCEREGI